MPRRLTIRALRPWSEFNEYEGEIEGVLDGVPVTTYVVMPSAKHWSRYAADDEVDVDAWLERSGPVVVEDGSDGVAFDQLDGPKYRVRGVVKELDGEQVVLESVLPIRVDLDLGPHGRDAIPEVSVGDRISVDGTLKVDLDPD